MAEEKGKKFVLVEHLYANYYGEKDGRVIRGSLKRRTEDELVLEGLDNKERTAKYETRDGVAGYWLEVNA